MTPATPAPINAHLRYPSLNHFCAEVTTCQSVDELNEHIAGLRKGQTRGSGIHVFEEGRSMAIAWSVCNKKGAQLAAQYGAYQMSDKTWRMPLKRVQQV